MSKEFSTVSLDITKEKDRQTDTDRDRVRDWEGSQTKEDQSETKWKEENKLEKKHCWNLKKINVGNANKSVLYGGKIINTGNVNKSVLQRWKRIQGMRTRASYSVEKEYRECEQERLTVLKKNTGNVNKSILHYWKRIQGMWTKASYITEKEYRECEQKHLTLLKKNTGNANKSILHLVQGLVVPMGHAARQRQTSHPAALALTLLTLTALPFGLVHMHLTVTPPLHDHQQSPILHHCHVGRLHVRAIVPRLVHRAAEKTSVLVIHHHSEVACVCNVNVVLRIDAYAMRVAEVREVTAKATNLLHQPLPLVVNHLHLVVIGAGHDGEVVGHLGHVVRPVEPHRTSSAVSEPKNVVPNSPLIPATHPVLG